MKKTTSKRSSDYAEGIENSQDLKELRENLVPVVSDVKNLVERSAGIMDGVLKIYERDGDENIVATKFVNLANCCCAYVTEEGTVLVMANRDTIRIPNASGNPFYEETQSSSEEE